MCSFKAENRILAKDVIVSNDTWRTRLNNNDLIIGASGSGKTSEYKALWGEYGDIGHKGIVI